MLFRRRDVAVTTICELDNHCVLQWASGFDFEAGDGVGFAGSGGDSDFTEAKRLHDGFCSLQGV